MALDNMVEDNAVYFKNLTLVTERLLCIEFIKVKCIGCMNVLYSYGFLALCRFLNSIKNNKEKNHSFIKHEKVA